jgi:hypothetical protein
MLFRFALEYTIRKVQENQVGLKLNGTHQLLVYVDDLNLLEDKLDTKKKTTEYLTVASREFGLEMNADRARYELVSIISGTDAAICTVVVVARLNRR